jgi:hypothetical protein
MKYHEADLNLIKLAEPNRNGNQYITYGPLNKALRVQLGRSASHMGLRNCYDKYYLDLTIDESTKQWWEALEIHLGCNKSAIWNGSLSVKVDEHTEIFDSENKLTWQDLRDGELSGELTVILEIAMVYQKEGTRAVSTRVYQAKHYPCAFD